MCVTRGDGGPVGVRSALDGSARGVAGPVSELAVGIGTPGPKGAVRFEGDRMISTRGYGGPVRGPGRFLGGDAPVCGGPITERATAIVAPRPEGGSTVRKD